MTTLNIPTDFYELCGHCCDGKCYRENCDLCITQPLVEDYYKPVHICRCCQGSQSVPTELGRKFLEFMETEDFKEKLKEVMK